MATVTTQKKWDADGVPLKDSNCAGIGSEEDKSLRKAAAQTEAAWKDCGQKAGLEVWRIEDFQVKAWPAEAYGKFHKGDSYIVLSTVEHVSEKHTSKTYLTHDIFFWLGKDSSIDEMGTAAYKTVELDDFFDGEPHQHREVMNSESTAFRQLFKGGIKYLEGGHASGFKKGVIDLYEHQLYRVRGKGKDVHVDHMPLQRSSLNQNDSFILDVGTKIYVWNGAASSGFEKCKANLVAENWEGQRNGRCTTTHDIDERFWKLLGGEGPIAADISPDDAVKLGKRDAVLYKIDDNVGGKLECVEVGRVVLPGGALDTSTLSSDDVMMLDTRGEIFIWVGKGASTAEGKSCYHLALDFIHTNKRPKETPMHVFKEGQQIKNPHWLEAFGAAK